MYYQKTNYHRMGKKYLIRVYTISSVVDEFTIFVGSTIEKKMNNIVHFQKKKNEQFRKWMEIHNANTFELKVIKKYVVKDRRAQEEKERYWIRKYTKDGFEVIHNQANSIKSTYIDTVSVTLTKTCFQEIINYFGERIVEMKNISKGLAKTPKHESPRKQTTAIREFPPVPLLAKENAKIENEPTAFSTTCHIGTLKTFLSMRSRNPKLKLVEVKDMMKIKTKTKKKKRKKKIKILPKLEKKVYGHGYMSELKQVLHQKLLQVKEG